MVRRRLTTQWVVPVNVSVQTSRRRGHDANSYYRRQWANRCAYVPVWPGSVGFEHLRRLTDTYHPSWRLEQVAQLLPRAAYAMIVGADHHMWFTHPKELQAPLRGFIQQVVRDAAHSDSYRPHG